MKIVEAGGSAIVTLQLLRIQTPAKPVASILASVDAIRQPRPPASIVTDSSSLPRTSLAHAASAYAESS